MSAERYWEMERPLPPQVQIGVNINMLDISERPDGSLDAPFVFTVNYMPSIAQISIKGKAKISGEDTKKIAEDHKAQKSPPPQLLQAVSNTAMGDAVLISRSLNIPPPLPPIPQAQTQAQPQPPKSDTRYTA